MPSQLQIRAKSSSSAHHLPTAHTCFQTLDLPPYESEAQLREKLDQCLANLDGMGFELS